MRYPRIYRHIMDLILQIYILVIFVTDLNGAQANEAVLVDTRTATSDLGWTIAQDSNWVEHTALDGSDNERRIVQVCAIRDQNQNNWLRTHFIEVESAERIYIEIEFSIRACEDVANVKSCKETFNLYYYESDKDIATSTFPPWREGPYVKIDTIAADKRFLPGSVDKLTNFETRDIGPIKKKGIYLAIQDTGACMAIMHVRVYYKYCPPHYQSLATFPRTIAGAEMTSLVAAEGACVANAVAEQKRPKLYCNGEGIWRVPSGTCMCSPGFEPNVDLTRCKPCAQKEYKNEIGNRRCERCPAYSSSMTTGSTVCACSKGYYRAETDDPTKECTKTPSKPRNLVSVVNNTSITLRWHTPTDNGGRKDVTFRITCSHCVAGFEVCQPCPRSVDIQPAQSGIKITSAIIKRLNAYSFYVFKVFAENGVSDKARRAGAVDNNYVEALVETSQAAPSPVVGVRTDPNGIKPTSILVIWDQPQVTNGEIIDYEVTAQKFRKPSSPEYPTVADTNEPTRINSTSNQHMKIEGLTPGTAYIIMVRARTTAGYGKFSVPIKAETSGGMATEPGSGATADGDRTLQLVVAVGCGLLIVILVIAIILFCTRRKQFGKGKKLDVEKQPMFSKEIPGHKTYVDPTTYEDPHRAVRDFTKEIDATTIKIEQVIGGGEFGDVCRGRMRHPGKSEQDVAIKTLKTGYTTQQKLDFLGEASIMGQFEHPNVIRLEGVVTKTRPLMIVTEYMQNGSLDVFLRNHDGEMTVLQLVGILRHIAEGMRYLSDMGYVHRDLAARNILVDDRLVCKVSDFGLSRVLEDDAEASYTTRGGKIPIRWTAPEAITFRKFTSASDVWSYGIVMWEVMSYGERPYWGMSNQDVIQAVGSGYRLPAPMDCPHVQHQLMLDCWKKDRNQRPKFPQIVTTLDRMLKEPTLLKIDSTTVRKPKTPQDKHARADSSDATTATTGASSDSSNTGSTERTATPNDDLTSQEDAPLVRQSPTVVPIGNGQVVYRRGSEIQIPTASLQQSPIAAPLTGSPASLGGWLDELSLGQYKDTFKKNGCTSLEQVLQLTSSDLMRMGVTSTPHQERILGSIMSMRESSSFNIYGRRPSKNKNYYQHRAKNYEPEAPPKYEETCRNGRIPNGIPV